MENTGNGNVHTQFLSNYRTPDTDPFKWQYDFSPNESSMNINFPNTLPTNSSQRYKVHRRGHNNKDFPTFN